MPLQPMITGARHMIAAGHYLATEAGHAVLQAGGNASTRASPAGIALGVVHSDQVQFSGVAPMIIYLAERDETVSIAGLGGWPRAARLETFVERARRRDPAWASCARWCRRRPTPGSWRCERYGTMSFGDVAARGHPLRARGLHHASGDGPLHRERTPRTIAAGRHNAAIYLPRRARRRARASCSCRPISRRTLQFMADEERAASARRPRSPACAAARDAFYRGDIAPAIVALSPRERRLADGARISPSYRSEIEPPLRDHASAASRCFTAAPGARGRCCCRC